MVFISGYQNDLYDTHLTGERGWHKETIRATTKGNNGKSFEREEGIWFNPVFRRALQTGRIPVRLSQKESRNKKVNPTR